MRIKFVKRVKKDIFNKLLDNIFGREEKLSYFCNVIKNGTASTGASPWQTTGKHPRHPVSSRFSVPPHNV